MRNRVPHSQNADHILISEVFIDQNSRHQLPPTLLALQHLYVDAELRESVLDHLSARLTRGNNDQGRLGLSLWEILVLGIVRLCEEADYDSLCDLANNHRTLRGVLGVLAQNGWGEQVYKCSTLKETVAQLDEATLLEINTLVVQAGHRLMGKKNRAWRRFESRAKGKS